MNGTDYQMKYSSVGEFCKINDFKIILLIILTIPHCNEQDSQALCLFPVLIIISFFFAVFILNAYPKRVSCSSHKLHTNLLCCL